MTILASPVRLAINGVPLGPGIPGSYATVSRQWARGDTLTLLPPAALRLERYSGSDQLPGYEGLRYAVLLGPIVLAATSLSMNASSAARVVLPVSADQPIGEWLQPTGTGRLHYRVQGPPGSPSDVELMPLFDLPLDAAFTVYPVFAGASRSRAERRASGARGPSGAAAQSRRA